MAYALPPNTKKGLCLSGTGLSERKSGPVGKLTFKITERGGMRQRPRSRVNRKRAKTVLRLLDLEHAKVAVRNSLTSHVGKQDQSVLNPSPMISAGGSSSKLSTAEFA